MEMPRVSFAELAATSPESREAALNKFVDECRQVSRRQVCHLDAILKTGHEPELQSARWVIQKWMDDNSSKVSFAFVCSRTGTRGQSGCLLVVVQRELQHDEQLEDALTSLDLELANDPQMSGLSIGTLSIPQVAMSGLLRSGDVEGDVLLLFANEAARKPGVSGGPRQGWHESGSNKHSTTD